MKKKFPKHPADGLYYLDMHILRRERACSVERLHWQREYPHTPRHKGVVTFAQMMRCNNPATATHWCIAHMYYQGLLVAAEVCTFHRQHNRLIYDFAHGGDRYDYDLQTVQLFMSILLRRAVREGRI